MVHDVNSSNGSEKLLSYNLLHTSKIQKSGEEILKVVGSQIYEI